jgi:WD40 repeat protein
LVLAGSSSGLPASRIACSPEQVFAISSDLAYAALDDHRIIDIFDLVSGESLMRFGSLQQPPLHYFWTAENTHLLVSTDALVSTGPTAGELILYELDLERKLSLSVKLKSIGEVHVVRFSRDGDLIAYGDNFTLNGEPHYGATQGEYSRKDNPSQLRLVDLAGRELYEWNLNTTAVVFSRDDTLLVAGASTGEIVFYSVVTGEEQARFADAHALPIVDLAFSTTGNLLFALSADGSVTIWGIPE